MFAVKRPRSFVSLFFYCSVRTQSWHYLQSKVNVFDEVRPLPCWLWPFPLPSPFLFSLASCCLFSLALLVSLCSQLLLLLLVTSLRISSLLITGITLTDTVWHSPNSWESSAAQDDTWTQSKKMLPTTGAPFWPTKFPHYLSPQAIKACQRGGIFTMFIAWPYSTRRMFVSSSVLNQRVMCS